MPSWLITGASRGIGLAIVQHLLVKESNIVIATARNPDIPAFKELSSKYPSSRFVALQLDVGDSASIDKAVKEAAPLLTSGLDYIVNNAGVNPQPLIKFEDVDLDVFTEELNSSIIHPLRVSRAFLPLIKKSSEKKIIFVSTVLASSQISYKMVNQLNTYSVAKAGLNMLGRKWGASLKGEGVSTALIHPGWVKTDIGDPLVEWMTKYAPDVAQLETSASAEGVIKVSEGLTLEKTASFWNVDGTALPW